MTRLVRGVWCAVGVSLALLGSTPRPASACGGFFCSQSPVDQTAERIIFTVNSDDTITAYVQISYAGERENFAWVVPVPSTPRLDVFYDLAMRALDTATQPQYLGPSCFLEEALDNSGSASGGGVTVYSREAVGPFDTVTLGGQDAMEVVEWLQDEGFRITDSMVPFLQVYADEGMRFVATKLLPTAEVSDIEPLVMTYVGTEPMIPIRLTAVAAQPEMSIVSWVLADERYGPKNYAELAIPDELVTFDVGRYGSNYLAVVSREADKLGGQAFVTEYAGPTEPLARLFETTPVNNPDPALRAMAEEANQALIDLLRGHAYVTRLYTRISPEEMTIDPIFHVSDDQSDVSNVHELDFPADACLQPPLDPCLFTYCGRSGACVALDANVAACACSDEATARAVTTGGDAASAYCEPLVQNLTSADEAGGFADPCGGFSCGDNGACATMNGNPTCRCERGFAAQVSTMYDATTGTSAIRMQCLDAGGEVPDLPDLPAIPSSEADMMPDEPEGGAGSGSTPRGGTPTAPPTPDPDPMPPGEAGDDGGLCAVTRGGQPTHAAWLGALAIVLALRRRRRMRRWTRVRRFEPTS